MNISMIQGGNSLLLMVKETFTRECIQPDELQWKILETHLNAVAERAKSGEKLPEMEEAMFAEISETSKSIARDILANYPTLPKEEILLLSMHVENARSQ